MQTAVKSELRSDHMSHANYSTVQMAESKRSLEMPYWLLILLVTTAWLLYPFAGAANVASLVAQGKRPEGAGRYAPRSLKSPRSLLFCGRDQD
jgi:hypothetical protein